eukprot:214584_1
MINSSQMETSINHINNKIDVDTLKPSIELNGMSETIPPPTHIFFAGASWGCGFYIGAYKALQEKYGLETLSKCKYSGNSAGALIALLGAVGLDWKVAEKVYLTCLNQAVEHGVFQKMSIYHDIAMDEVLKKSDEMYKELNNKLFVGVTHFIDSYELISKWNNNKELRDCLHASMHIPYYCTHINKIGTKKGNKICIDGSFSTMFHRFDKTTLVMTAMSHKGDISSDPELTFFKDCYSPDLENYYKMRDNGYHAMNKWNGRYKWNEYSIYTKSKYRLKKKRLININMKKIIVFCFWIARMLEEIKIKRILCFVICIFLYKKVFKNVK